MVDKLLSQGIYGRGNTMYLTKVTNLIKLKLITKIIILFIYFI